MPKFKSNYLKLLWKLIWKNRIIKSRIATSFGFSLFFLVAIPVFQFLEVASLNTYTLLFLSGMFYHFYVTIYSLSCLYSYFKFLINYRVLIRSFALIYFFGILSSILGCIIVLGYSWAGYIEIDVGQIYLSFLISNFVFAPLCFWASSYDFVKINLFSPLSGFYQPRPIYIAVMLVSVLVFSLLLDARSEFLWPLGLSVIVILVIIGIIGVMFKFILKKVYINCQKSLMR